MIPLKRPATHPFNRRLAMLFVTLFCVWITAVQAATVIGVIGVTSVEDNGVGTLRAALASAADGDTIDASSISGTILLTSGELRVTKSVTILGPGHDILTVNGNSASRVFHVNSNVVVRISNLTITNGLATRNQRVYRRGPFGGGIFSDHASLTVSHCTLSGNNADFGGAIYVDGGTLTIDTSTLSSNKALNGGAVYVNGGTLAIDNSTLSHNSAGFFGGGVYNRGGVNGSAILRIHNSTLSGNSAKGDHGGGVYNLGGSNQRRANGGATLQILNSTLSGNSSFNARHGGGIYIQGCADGCATLEIGSTILDAGTLGRNIFSSGGTVTSVGYNLSSDDGSGFLTTDSDQLNTDPFLGPLEDNGGPTFTHALSIGSPAIDAGYNLIGAGTDQRGTGFARTFDEPSVLNVISSDGTDIGAFELPPVVMTNIEHVVVLMLENRSLDNVLGWLYEAGEKPARVVPAGSSASFDGVAGKNLFNQYQLNRFTKIYTLPVLHGVVNLRAPVYDPYEEYAHVNVQLFADRRGNMPSSITYGTPANMNGFAYDFDASYETVEQLNEVMGAYTPQQLPVLNGLARSYGVSDRWFSSVPTQTDPNRAFSLCGTSLGRTENEETIENNFLEFFDTKTIWNTLPLGVSWGIYYCEPWQFPVFNNPGKCWTELTFPQIEVAMTAANNYRANSAVISPIANFLAQARAGTLPDFSLIEPAWGGPVGIGGVNPTYVQGNDYHPPTYVGPGEDFVNRVYEALISNTNAWAKTLLIITFDEHGGTYDHVDPGWGAVPPDSLTGGDPVFHFDRYGVRVPTILVSPWIPAGTVFRAPAGSTHPFDHTSLIATILKWKAIDPATAGLGNRVAVAPTFESALGDKPRSDTPHFSLPGGYAGQGGGAKNVVY